MTEKEEYGLEDVCVALDGIETQLKRLVRLEKRRQRHNTQSLNEIAEIDSI